jgi:hypothetical protein
MNETFNNLYNKLTKYERLEKNKLKIVEKQNKINFHIKQKSLLMET